MYPLGSTNPPTFLVYVLYGFPPNRIQSSKFTSEIAWPTKTNLLNHHNKKLFHMECGGFCKNSASFPVMCYHIGFIDTVYAIHNFMRKTKLIPLFIKEEIEFIISKITKFLFRLVIFHGIFWRYNSLVFREFSNVYYLKIAGAFRVSFLDPVRGLTPPLALTRIASESVRY